MKCYNLTKMTWEEVESALETVQLAVVPVGAHEQHGPHMTESCDAVLAEKMAERLGDRMFPYVLITPTISMGVSPHHLNFPGTISLQPDTLIAILRDVVSSLQHHGIKKFLFLNAHGGNMATLNTASALLSKEFEVEVYYAKTTAAAKESIKSYISSPLFGHSCEREVSEALYLAPELVRKDKITKGEIQIEGRWRQLRPGGAIQGFYRYEEMTKNGCIGNAMEASREIGEKIVEEALNRLTEELLELLDLERVNINELNFKKI